MAIKDTRAEDEHLNRFWPRYHKLTLMRALGLQIAICVIVIGVVLMLYPSPPLEAWIVIFILSAMAIVTTLITTTIAMRPVKELSSALVHVSGEPTGQIPPNMNDDYYARNKMRPLLKQIYDLASSSRNPAPESSAPSELPNVITQLNHTSTGLVMMDEAGEIIFANQSAPISVDGNGKKS